MARDHRTIQRRQRYRLVDWASTLQEITISLAMGPTEYSQFPNTDISRFAAGFPHPPRIAALRSACRIEDTNRAVRPAAIDYASKPSLVANAMRGRALEDPAYAMRKNTNATIQGAESDFVDKGGAAKIRAWAKSMPEKAAGRKFRDSDIAIDVSSLSRSSLDSAASGTACYLAFCDLMNFDLPHPPPAHRPPLLLAH